MQSIKLTKNNQEMAIEMAVAVLENGGLVVAPTETTYGVLADATKDEAVAKVLAFKRRLSGKALSILVPDRAMAEKYVEINDQAAAMYEALLPGAYTIISRGKKIGGEAGGRVRESVQEGVQNEAQEKGAQNEAQEKKEIRNKTKAETQNKTQKKKETVISLAEAIFSEAGNVGVRIPDCELVRELGAAVGRPLTATSANLSGGKNPYTINDVFAGLREKQKNLIELVIDAGELPKNPPSVVIDTTGATPVALRGELPATKTFITHSPTETQALAKKILTQYQNQIATKGLVLALDGQLGAGKTIFSQGVASAIGLSEPLTSPTYTYIKEYNLMSKKEGRQKTSEFPQQVKQLFHLDAWRIETAEELEFLQPQNWLGAGKLVLIEWYDQIADFWSKNYATATVVRLEFLPDEKDEQKRQIRLIELKKNEAHNDDEK